MAKKIMILDDDEATAELIEYYLKEEGFQTAISLTGEGFPEKVAEYQPDLITLDILLPSANGFDIFMELQQDERTRDIPVVFITALEGSKDEGIKMGARGYIAKPFKEEHIKEIVESILGGRKKNEEASHC